MMKEKKCQKRRRKKSEDRISSLPDCLLVDIISRLPYTEDAFATGILSKRWKHVWTHVPNLIFHHDDVDDDPKRLRKFYSFVDNILSQRDHSNNLNRFLLWSSYTQKIKSRVNNCILYAINHNVKEFDIDVWDHSRSTGPELPQAFFASSSFIHLRLSRCTFEQTCVISWSNLKSLYISHMELDESLIQNILSGSPLLETLELNECFGYRLLDINNKCVKNLVISGYREGRFIYSPEINVVEINAPYILSLSIQDSFVLEKLLLLNVSSVIEAELNYWEAIKDNRTYRDDEMNEEMLKGLLLSLGHVKEVKIRKWSLKALTGLKAKGFIYPSNLKVLGEIDSS